MPKQYYLQMRLRRARELLLQTSMPIMDITTACGFQSPPHFSRCYRTSSATRRAPSARCTARAVSRGRRQPPPMSRMPVAVVHAACSTRHLSRSAASREACQALTIRQRTIEHGDRAAEGEFNLRDLNDQELTEQVHDDLYNGLKAEVEEATHIFLERGWSAEKVLNDALVEGMRIVGIDFRDGILFVPEVLLAANSMKGGMEILRPLLAETGVEPIGKIVIGTVKGDIHDIGKNLVSMMLEGAGFEVIDLGINNPVEKYLDGAREAQARHPRHVGAADDDHALHEGRHRQDEGEGHPQGLHRAGRRRAAERGVRQGGRRRCLLPRRRDRGRDRQEPDRRAPCRRTAA